MVPRYFFCTISKYFTTYNYTFFFLFKFCCTNNNSSILKFVTCVLIDYYYTHFDRCTREFFSKKSQIICYLEKCSPCLRINDLFDYIHVCQCTTLIINTFNYLLLKITIKIVYFESTCRNKSNISFSSIYMYMLVEKYGQSESNE
jgi:hypothetical protein